MRLFVIVAALAMPGAVFAVGSDSSEPPTPTPTTTDCTDGQIWDEEAEVCVDPEGDTEESRLSPDTLYNALRELAYAGRYDDALRVVAAMPQDDRAFTYLGFIHRKSGDVEQGMTFYAKALDMNPGNILARSYRGQAHVEAGNLDLARADRAAITDQDSWAWKTLDRAIRTGETSDY